MPKTERLYKIFWYAEGVLSPEAGQIKLPCPLSSHLQQIIALYPPSEVQRHGRHAGRYLRVRLLPEPADQPPLATVQLCGMVN